MRCGEPYRTNRMCRSRAWDNLRGMARRIEEEAAPGRRPVNDGAEMPVPGDAPLSAAGARLVAVLALDPADRSGRGAHHHALGGDAALAALDALEQRAVRDSGRGEDDVALS